MNKASLLEFAKKLNIPRQNCMKTKEELGEAIKDTIKRYKDTPFGSDTPVCMECLEKLRKRQVINQKIYDQKLIEDMIRKLAWEGLQKNIVMNGDTIKEPVRCWILRMIRHIGKGNFKTIFIVFIDYKITCRRVEELHILNGIDNLGT